MLRIALLLMASLLNSLAHAKDDLSLSEIRSRLIGQEVVILGEVFGGYGPNSKSLVFWRSVKGDDDSGYKFEWPGSDVPSSLRGRRGVVISVEEQTMPLRAKKSGGIDAFGKPIDDSRVMNPKIQVVVKTNDDGVLIGTTGTFGIMNEHYFRLSSRADELKKEMEGNLERLMGKSIYKVAYTKLLDSAISLDDLMDRNKRELATDYQTRNLTPLKIKDAKYLEAENAVVIRVELPSGEPRLLFGKLDRYYAESAYKPSLIERIGISAEEKIPPKLSPREISAIKDGKVFRGMSEDALWWSLGLPEKTNDWGKGGKQYIYPGGLYIYVDGKVVRDWQSTGR